MWITEATLRDFLVNLAAGLVSGFLIFMVGLRWKLVSSFFTRERAAFRRIFGESAVEAGFVTVTLDTYRDLRLLSPEVQQKLGIQPVQTAHFQGSRFYKIFPDGHITWFPGAYGDILGHCSARGAAYLNSGLTGIGNVNVRVVSDGDVASEWNGTFINLGSSSSNIKTDDIKHFPENCWLENDLGEFKLKDGRVIKIDERGDKGIIIKLLNPFFSGYSLFICAGLGEWGGSGSAWYLSTRWRQLSYRFGKGPFLIVVNVKPGSDHSTSEILAYGNESRFWKIRSKLLFQ